MKSFERAPGKTPHWGPFYFEHYWKAWSGAKRSRRAAKRSFKRASHAHVACVRGKRSVIARPFTDGGPADPDRPWAWRDSGDGAETADDIDDGAYDDEASFAAAAGTAFARVTFMAPAAR